MLQPPTPLPQETNPARRLTPLAGLGGSLGQRVYQSLREAILSVAYRPGEILRKPEICAALGVSRSPVSDAVAKLAAEGLLDVVPQAGTFVARFSMADIREGAFLREAIELHAVAMVAQTITEPQLQLLRRNLTLQAALIADGDIPGFYQADADLHGLILSFTGYRKLAQVADTAWLHVNRARQMILPVPGRVQQTLEEHRAIVSALEARDVAAARAATQVHLAQLIHHLEPLERDRPELFDQPD